MNAYRPRIRPHRALLGAGLSLLLLGCIAPSGLSAQTAESQEREVAAVLEEFWGRVMGGEMDHAIELVHPDESAAIVAALRTEGQEVVDMYDMFADPISLEDSTDDQVFAWLFELAFAGYVTGGETSVELDLVGWTGWGPEGRAVIDRTYSDAAIGMSAGSFFVQPLRLNEGEWRVLMPSDFAEAFGLVGTAMLETGIEDRRVDTLERFRASLADGDMAAASELLHAGDRLRIVDIARAATTDHGVVLEVFFGTDAEGVDGMTDQELVEAFLYQSSLTVLRTLSMADEVHVEGVFSHDDTDVLCYWTDGAVGPRLGAIQVRDDDGRVYIDLSGGILSALESLASA